MYEYKVITESDSRFSGRFDAESLETTLNSYAADGWRVVESVLAANLAKSSKAQVMVVLERGANRIAKVIRADAPEYDGQLG